MYHDVVASAAHTTRGFPPADAALFKLPPENFAAHLAAIAEAVKDEQPLAAELLASESLKHGWALTFDDGGASSYPLISDLLTAKNWRGWFFITTDYIDSPGFLTRENLRALAAGGHIIGSHSCSHPPRFSHCSATEMRREWRDSLSKLRDVLGAQVTSASVPGGYYSTEVARAAAETGVKILFTSEPKTTVETIDGCRVIGRYAMQRTTLPATAAAIAAGNLLPRLQQATLWQAKKLVKGVGGNAYLELRKKLLGSLKS